MSAVTLSPNLATLLAGLPGLKSEVEKAGEKILAVANGIVPVDTGATQASGHVEMDERDGKLIAHVTYSTPYAVYLEFGTHDTPTFAMLRRGAEGAGFKLSKGH